MSDKTTAVAVSPKVSAAEALPPLRIPSNTTPVENLHSSMFNRLLLPLFTTPAVASILLLLLILVLLFLLSALLLPLLLPLLKVNIVSPTAALPVTPTAVPTATLTPTAIHCYCCTAT